jgi:ankyrin repeat protein
MDLLLASQTNEIMQALDSNQFLGSTVLMALCEFNHLEAVHYIFDEVMYSREDRVLLTNQKNANRCDWTALHYASWEAHSNMVKTLVECGANVDIADAFGRTPLHYACLRGNLSIISALIELGADTNKRDLGIAKLGDKPGNGKTAFESIPNSQNYQRITKAFKDSQAKFAQIRHQQRSLKLSSAMSKSKKSSHDQDGVQATSNASSGSTTPSRSSAYTNVQENGAYIQRLRAMQQE